MYSYIKYYFFLLIFTLCAVYTSTAQCYNGTISSAVHFPEAGGTEYRYINFANNCTSGVDVTFGPLPSWITITEQLPNGTYIKITCTENEGQDREAGISILNNGVTTGGFSITQEGPEEDDTGGGTGGGGTGGGGATCSITGLPSTISFPQSGDTETYDLDLSSACYDLTDLVFTTTSGQSLPSWVTVTQPEVNTVRITVSANTGDSRFVYILGTSENNNKTIATTIRQDECEQRWYIDRDNDTYGDSNQTAIICQEPDDDTYTYVTNNNDCNDSNRLINPETRWYYDGDDGDNFGDPNRYITQCEQPVDYVLNNTDGCPGVAGDSNGCESCLGLTTCRDRIDFPIDGGVINTYIEFAGPCSDPQLTYTFPSWVTILDETLSGNGTYIRITCDSNAGNLSRGETVVAINHGYNTAGGFLVTQDGTDGSYYDNDPIYDDCTITGFPNSLSFPPEGGFREYTITTTHCDYNGYNYTFTANGGQSLPSDFLTITQPEATKIRIWVEPNTGIQRSIIVTAASTVGDIYRGFTISQQTACPTEELFGDTDGDGYGDPFKKLGTCEEPIPGLAYVSNNLDCNDLDYLLHPNTAWYEDTDNDGFGDPNSTPIIQCEKPQGQYANNPHDFCVGISGEEYGCPVQPTIMDENYILTVAAQSEHTNLMHATDEDMIQNITYYDGIGRSKQSITKQAGGNKQDMITPMVYDAFGKPSKEYLPYADPMATLPSLVLRDHQAVLGDTEDYYANTYPEDIDASRNNPYAEKQYEPSPLNRVIEQGAPGKHWLVDPNSDDDHTIKFDWGTNTTNEIVYFEVVFDNGDTEKPQLHQEDFYTANELFITTTKDENWKSGNDHTTQEYTNKRGQVVLKRTYNEGIAHDTYYVYDRFGNLTYVLPAKVDTQDGVSTTELNALCYQYVYDHRNRLIKKKLPGKAWEAIVYNTLDQPVLTQDAILKEQGKWLFTRYDALGRVAYTGTLVDARERIDLQAEASSFSNQLWVARASRRLIGGASLYYSSTGWPSLTNAEVLTVQYYDDYQLPALVAALDSDMSTSYGVPIEQSVKGLPTIAMTKVLTTDAWILTRVGYDHKGRQIAITTKNQYLEYTDTIVMQLDFTGNILQQTTTHTKAEAPTIQTVDQFTYDHMQRLLTQTQTIQGQQPEVIVNNHYDELGQLDAKTVGNGLQHIEYNYNVRGWLTSINDPSNLGTHLFGFKINYTTAEQGATPLYNGNIAETHWATGNDHQQRWYAYNYDALNRITQGVSSDGHYNVSNITYDKMGNIQTLSRKGHLNDNATLFGDMDILSYTYDSGNTLQSVTDVGNTTFGFVDGNTTGNDYTYDDNGNMIADQNKGITGIAYNHLNLPGNIAIDNAVHTGNITYIYDATGNKQKKLVSEGSSLTETEYAGNYIYKNGELEFFNHSEGYTEPVVATDGTRTGYRYTYQYKDHLGNIRLSYQDSNSNEVYQDVVFTDFATDLGGWTPKANTTAVLENGKVKVTVDDAWEGIQYRLSEFAVAPMELFKLSFDFDKGSTTNNIRLYVQELDANGYHLSWNTLHSDLSTGAHEYFYTIKSASSMVIYIDKGDTPQEGATHFYVDEFKLIKATQSEVDGLTQTSTFDIDTDGWKAYQNSTISNEAGRLRVDTYGNSTGTYKRYDVPQWAKEMYINLETARDGDFSIFLTLNEYDDSGFIRRSYLYEVTNGTYGTAFDLLDETTQVELFVRGTGLSNTETAQFFIDNVATVFYTDAIKIVEEKNYYPFGLEHKGYNNTIVGREHNHHTYLGQEWQEELGLNWHTYKWRNADPTIGRFFGIDPIAEDYPNQTVYQFASNNPVWKIELEGLEGIEISGDDIMNGLGYGIDTGDGTAVQVGEGGFLSKGYFSSALSAVGDFFGAIHETISSSVASGVRSITGTAEASTVMSNSEFSEAVVSGDENAVYSGLEVEASAAYNAIPEFTGEVTATALEMVAAELVGGTKGTQTKTNVHGNSKSSTASQHGYEITNTTTGTRYKVGVSGGKLNQNGTSRRANSQVNKLNRQGGGVYKAEVKVQGVQGRQNILDWEQTQVDLFYQQTGTTAAGQKRPKPTGS